MRWTMRDPGDAEDAFPDREFQTPTTFARAPFQSFSVGKGTDAARPPPIPQYRSPPSGTDTSNALTTPHSMP
jgi:hypothetical protein